MENKMNLVEILKDCPKGMELDCTISNDVVFEKIEFDSTRYPVVVRKLDTGISIFLTKYGQYVDDKGYKCVIFPKGKTTWEGFRRPFKDGDVITCTNSCCTFVSIFKERIDEDVFVRYCAFILGDNELKANTAWSDFSNPRFATEEEKQELFDVIKSNGYKWNAETKTLEKLIEPKFKVGDRIRYKRGNRVKLNIVSININEQFYHTSDKGRVYFKYQDDWDLVSNKFDITTLVPFESRVLVREGKSDIWQPSYYGFLNQRNKRFYTTTNTWSMCIPYNEDTKHLIGTTNDCEEFYKTWK